MDSFFTNLTVWEWVVAGAIVVGGVVWRQDRQRLVAWLDKRLTPREQADLASVVSIVQALAPDAVLFVEHSLPQAAGVEKFAAAVERILGILAAHGISASDSMQSLVQAAVQAAYAAAKQDGRLAASAGTGGTSS
jgi:hypothetical protein